MVLQIGARELLKTPFGYTVSCQAVDTRKDLPWLSYPDTHCGVPSAMNSFQYIDNVPARHIAVRRTANENGAEDGN